MSLEALLALAELSRKYRAGELSPEESAAIDERNKLAYERCKVYDREIAERIRLKEPTAELLRKTCSI